MLLLISVGVTGSRQIASLVCVRGEGSTLRILQPKGIRKPNLHPAPPLGQLSGLHYSRPCDYTVLHMPKSSGYQTPHRAVLTSYFSPHRTDCSFSSPLYSAIPKVRAVWLPLSDLLDKTLWFWLFFLLSPFIHVFHCSYWFHWHPFRQWTQDKKYSPDLF